MDYKVTYTVENRDGSQKVVLGEQKDLGLLLAGSTEEITITLTCKRVIDNNIIVEDKIGGVAVPNNTPTYDIREAFSYMLDDLNRLEMYRDNIADVNRVMSVFADQLANQKIDVLRALKLTQDVISPPMFRDIHRL